MTTEITTTFNVEIARQVGERAATIHNHLSFWINHNQNKGHNIRDGRAWVHMTIAEIAEKFPYLTEKQVLTAVYKLKKAGLIDTGNYNKWANDHTTWFGLPISADKIDSQPANSVTPDDQTVSRAAHSGRALPDIYPDTHPDLNHDTHSAPADDNPLNTKRGVVDPKILAELDRYRQHVADFGNLGRMLIPIDQAIALVGVDIVANAIGAAAIAGQNPKYDRSKLPSNLTGLLRDEGRLRYWAGRYSPKSEPSVESTIRSVALKLKHGRTVPEGARKWIPQAEALNARTA